ncbi:MAG: LamG domain-containing protein [Ferruginibacter sp.]
MATKRFFAVNSYNRTTFSFLPALLMILFMGLSTGKLTAQTGAALNFDGTDDHVAVATGYPATDNITYEAWVKPTALGLGYRSIVMNNSFGAAPGNVHFQFDGGRLMLAISNSGDYYSDFVFSLNTWYHVAATYSRSLAEVKFYVNGTAQETRTALTPPTINPNQAFRIGSWAGGAGREFVGDIDEVRIWSVARTAPQIAASYNCELEVPQTGLQIYYQFNQGTAGGSNGGVTTLTDITSNGRNGTLTNFALTGASSNWVTPGGVTSNGSCTAATGDYRSIAAGPWETASNWQRFNGTVWTSTTNSPTFSDNNISVLHAMTINGSITLDQTTVQSNASIQVNSGTITINDGTGTDLSLNSVNAIIWSNGPLLNVSSGALISGPTAVIFYRGATLTNNGTIDTEIAMSPDPGAQTINGTGSIQRLTLVNSNGVTLGGNQTITTLLNFNAGLLNTGTNKVIIASTASVQNNSGTEWYVNGNLQMDFAAGTGTKTYRIGDALGYRPVDVTVFNSNGSGGVTVSTTNPDHPNIATSQINPAKSVNRYWSVEVGVGNTDVWTTFNWTVADQDAGLNANAVIVNEYNPTLPGWFTATIISQTATSTRVRTVSAGRTEFQVGESLCVPTNDYRSTGSGNWNSPSTWETFNGCIWVPAVSSPSFTNNNITIRNGHNVTVTASVTIDQTVVDAGGTLTVSAGTLTINNGSGSDLTINGSFVWAAETASLTVNAQASVDGGTPLNYTGAVLTNRGDINLEVTFNSSGAQTLNGTTLNSTSIFIINMNNPNGLTLNGGSTQVSGLNFISGNITTGASSVVLNQGAVVTGASAANGYVIGSVYRSFELGTSTLEFPVGNSTAYAPVSVTLNGVGGLADVSVRNIGTEHPQISSSEVLSSNSVNTYWDFDQNGGVYTSADVTFNWDPVLVDGGANTSNFRVGQYYSDASQWSVLPSSNQQPTSISTTGITSFTDMSYAVGETIPATLNDYRTVGSGSWSDAGIWQRYDGSSWISAAVAPNYTNANVITLKAPHTVTLNSTFVEADQLVINEGATLNAEEAALYIFDASGVDLICNGTINLSTSDIILNNNGQASFEDESRLNFTFTSSLRGDGTVDILAGSIITFDSDGGANFLDGNINLNNSGTCNFIGSSGLDINNTSKFTNQSDGIFNWTGSANIAFNGTENQFTNNGFLYINTDAGFVNNGVSPEIRNNGSIFRQSGSGDFIITNNPDLTFFNNGGLNIESGNVIINGGPGFIDVGGSINISSGATLTGGSINFTGNPLGNNGTVNATDFSMSGTSLQLISGPGTINNLTINNASDVLLDGNQTISNNLNLVSGKIITGAHKIILNDITSITGGSNGSHVNGNVQRLFTNANPGSYLLPIGDGTVYAPLLLGPSINVSGDGYVTAFTTAGDHPDIANSGIDGAKSVNRKWTITNNSLNFSECDVTFNWTETDADLAGNFNNYILGKLDGGVWTLPVVSGRTSSSLSVLDLTSFSEFQIGEPQATTPAAALNFDGVNDQVVISNPAIDLTNKSFSVEMWLKRNSSNTYDVAFAQGTSGSDNQLLHIGFSNENEFIFNFFGGPNDLEIPITNDANWHHWACTFDNVAKTRKVYRDGVLIGQATIPTSTFVGNGSFTTIGVTSAYPGDEFDGSIDEVRIWTKTLSAAEVLNNFNCEISSQPGLIAAYHFNQGFRWCQQYFRNHTD